MDNNKDTKNNMKKAMYDMFGVGGGDSAKPAADTKQAAPAPEKPAATPAAKKPEVQPAAAPAKAAPVAPADSKHPASYLAPGSIFEGNFRAKGDVEIAGEFKGDITSEGKVLLRSNIESNIQAESVALSGCTLAGNINAKGAIIVSKDSKVIGNITAKSLQCAGTINGDIKVSGNTQIDTTARINGGIVTATIAVAAGAMLNGSVEMKPANASEVTA